jgi:hypothetical protein
VATVQLGDHGDVKKKAPTSASEWIDELRMSNKEYRRQKSGSLEKLAT